MNIDDSYYSWPNGTLCRINQQALIDDGFTQRDFLSYVNTVAEVVKEDGQVARLWWPSLGEYCNWGSKFIVKLKP